MSARFITHKPWPRFRPAQKRIYHHDTRCTASNGELVYRPGPANRKFCIRYSEGIWEQ